MKKIATSLLLAGIAAAAFANVSASSALQSMVGIRKRRAMPRAAAAGAAGNAVAQADAPQHSSAEDKFFAFMA